MGTCPTVTVPAPAPWDFCLSPTGPADTNPQIASKVLGLTLAVSKASSMGGGFRRGCGRTKAGGGVMGTKPLQEQGETLWGRRGDPHLQNHLVVKNNQCLALPVDAPGEAKSFWQLTSFLWQSGRCAHHTVAPDLYGKPQQHWRWATGPAGHPGMLGWKSPGRLSRILQARQKCASSPRDMGTAEVAPSPSPAPPLHSPLQTPWILRMKTMTTSPAARTSRSRGCS